MRNPFILSFVHPLILSFVHPLILSFLLLLPSCSEDATLDVLGMFSPNGPTVGRRFAESMAYNSSVGDIYLDMGADDYTVYVCTDSHITRNSHRNLDYFVHTYSAAPAPKLALHLGDLIDGQKNFSCADSILSPFNPFTPSSPHPFLFITPGNHDIYFKQWEEYRSFFKTSVYWFDTRNGSKPLDLFICLDSAEGELGADQMSWLRRLLEAKSAVGYRHIIVFTHTHLWKLDASQGHTSNYAMETTYELCSLLSKYGVEYVWSGHQHARQRVLFKGVEYIVLNATKDAEHGQSYMTARMGATIAYDYHAYPSAE